MTTAPADLPVRCACGALRGLVRGVSPRNSYRAVCYCDDCQKYAHFLRRADEILDPHGGTEVLQTSPARLEITTGSERLACVRLTPKGILRWYAACCRTPVGNTPSTQAVPYLGLVRSCIDAASAHSSLDALPGPVRWRVFARHAKGDRAGIDAHDGVPLSAMLAVMGRVLTWRLRGEHRHSPFFDARARPRVRPHVLDSEELRRVESAQRDWIPSRRARQ